MAKVYGSSLFDMAVCTKSIRLLFKCVCKIELYVMSDLSDKSEQKYSQRYFMSDQSVFAAFDVNVQ